MGTPTGSGPTAIGVDIGGTHLRASRITATGEILERVAEHTAADPEAALAQVIGLVRRLDRPGVLAIGVGVPGRVDAIRRQVLSGGFLDLSTVRLAERLAEAAGKPVVIDNDCSMALAAEMAIGAASGRDNVVMLTIGTGIGGAVAAAGQLLRGRATAGQLGHITVDVHGELCVCGRRGCVETTSSGTALGRHLTQAGLDPATPAETLFARAAGGETTATAVIAAWAGPLRAAIDSAVAMFDPEVVVLGGGLGSAAHRALDRLAAPAPWYQCPVVPARVGDDAGVIGAGLQALKAAPAPTAHAHGGKRAVLVNGVPASGKSTIARGIADRTGWPLLTLDTIKDPFLEVLGGADREFNRTLGKASYKAIWSLVRDAPAGTTFVIDAWFGFQPRQVLEDYLAQSGVVTTAELWCHAPPAILADRYLSRVHDRPAGHPGESYARELVELAGRAAPLERGPLLAIDTTAKPDFAAISSWLATSLEPIA